MIKFWKENIIGISASVMLIKNMLTHSLFVYPVLHFGETSGASFFEKYLS